MFLINLGILCPSFICQFNSKVEILETKFLGTNFVLTKMMSLIEKDKFLKVKYFAGNNASKRVEEWSKNKNLVCITSGTYMSHLDVNQSVPLGICIENGKIINRKLENWDAISVIDSLGNIQIYDINNFNLINICSDFNRVNNLNNNIDRLAFLNCCKQNELSVFQTHLLYRDNNLRIINSNNKKPSKRRFLISGKDPAGSDFICVLQVNNHLELYDATLRAKDFLIDEIKLDDMKIINLDAGANDVLIVYDEYGDIVENIHGSFPLHRSCDLLVFYY